MLLEGQELSAGRSDTARHGVADNRARQRGVQERPVIETALALEDGSVFIGEPFGAPVDAAAEVVFNTRITGYQEVVTDPSYRGQMVVMTHPQIGNYGIASSADESVRPWISAFIVRELAPHPHHWEARSRLEDFLNGWSVPGLQGIDTRALVP